MNAEVKNEKVTNDGQMPILIESKQEVEDSVELIEPKVELIEEMEVKKEEIDEDQYQHIIPHEYRDYLDQHAEEEQPTSSRKRPADGTLTKSENPIECRRCGKEISSSKTTNVRSHAIRHTSLKMYECPASQCSFKEYSSGNVTVHIKRKHKSCTDPVREIEMSDVQKQELQDMIHECFPKLERTKLNSKRTFAKYVTCQICQQSVKKCKQAKQEHSIKHISPLLFKCNEEDCDFSTNFIALFSVHKFIKHQKTCHPNHKIHLIMKQEREMQKWNDMCFSNKDVVGVSSTKADAEEVTDNGQVPNQTELKQEVEDSVEWIPYRDYLEQNIGEEQPTSCRKRRADDKSTPESTSSARGGTDVICQLCHQSVNERDKLDHSNGHIDQILFKCDDCDFSTNFADCLSNHVWIKHRRKTDSKDRKLQLANEQMTIRKWNNMCFPNGDSLTDDITEIVDYPTPAAVAEKVVDSTKTVAYTPPVARRIITNKEYDYICQICQTKVTEVSFWSQNARKNHASEHVDIMLYKCSIPDCHVQTKDQNAMIDHEVKIHGILVAYSGKCRIPMTTTQIGEIERMFIRCLKESSKEMSKQSDISHMKRTSVEDCKQDNTEHLNKHIVPLLFECGEQNCDFSTKFADCLSNHVWIKHRRKTDWKEKILQLAKVEVTSCKWNDMYLPNREKVEYPAPIAKKFVRPGKDVKEEDLTVSDDYPAPVARKVVKPGYCYHYDARCILEHNNYICQVCQKEVTEESFWSQNARKNHASEHVDIMLYKCSVPDCHVQTKEQNAMIDHEVKIHGLLVAYSGKCRIPMTTSQIGEIERMFIRCSPESSKK